MEPNETPPPGGLAGSSVGNSTMSGFGLRFTPSPDAPSEDPPDAHDEADRTAEEEGATTKDGTVLRAGDPTTIGEALRQWPTVPADFILRSAADAAIAEEAGIVSLRHLILATLRFALYAGGASGTEFPFLAAFFRAVASEVGQDVVQSRVPRGGPEITEADGIGLSPMAGLAISQAGLIARLDGSNESYLPRYLVLALTAPLREELTAVLKRVWKRRWEIEPQVLYPALREARDAHVSQRNPIAWRSLGGGETVTPGFANDAADPEASDPMGFAQDTKHLAELTCLIANRPPMAVALFGDWGSGKSTFMARMAKAVDAITKASPNLVNKQGQRVFDQHIVQIRFNAWTYDDANLWAGMATEIFNQLRIALTPKDQRGQASLHEPVRNLLQQIGLNAADAKATDTALQVDIATQRASLAEDRRRLEALERTTAQDSVEHAYAALRSEAAHQLAADPTLPRRLALATGLASADQVEQVETLMAEARSMTDSARRVSVRLRTALSLLGTNQAWPLLLAVALVVLGPAILPHLLNSGWSQTLTSALGSLLAGAMAIATFLRNVGAQAEPLLLALRRLDPTIQRLADARQSAIDTARERAQAASHLTASIADAEARLALLEARQMDSAKAAHRLAEMAAGRQPAALLRAFLEESAELREIGDRLGLMSRLNRVFRSLSDLMRDAKKKREDDMTAGRNIDTTLPRIDRIILYVDDLDRCRPAQVVQVLEALALLLQFDLFIAIVAVDERWLNVALKAHYGALIAAEGLDKAGNYLEKIFQIPFWLPSMRDTAVNRYGAFVAHLAPEAVAKAPASGRLVNEQGDTYVNEEGKSNGTATVNIDPDEMPQDDDVSPFAYENPGDTVERVSLTEPELQVLTALAPLAGGTPRAVKRFVNLYRLMRAARPAEDMPRWLGDDVRRGQFRYAAFALACQSGASFEVLKDIAIEMGRFGETSVSTIANAWLRLYGPRLPSDMSARAEFLQSFAGNFGSGLNMMVPPWAYEPAANQWIRVAIGLSTIGVLGPDLLAPEGAQDSLDNFAPIWREAARFSFNRPT